MRADGTGDPVAAARRSRRGGSGRSGFLVTLGAVVAASGAAWGWQRSEVAALRAERAQARREADEWTRLRAEQARLRATQIGAEELERLRADRAALPRLRAELEALRGPVRP